jgi:hypothetical protein
MLTAATVDKHPALENVADIVPSVPYLPIPSEGIFSGGKSKPALRKRSLPMAIERDTLRQGSGDR